MVSWSILWEHALALVLVWSAVVLAGLALLPLLRLHIGRFGAPLVGIVYWTLALYAFPFTGGLDVAAGLIIAMAVTRLWLVGRVFKPSAPIMDEWQIRPTRRFLTLPAFILVVGSLPYLTTLLYHYVPFGMDASMHTTAAALIARTGGLPNSYAPFAPDLTFPPMNLGLPTVAAVAIRWGGDPAAVMLACHHLTFTALILATYVLLRSWIGRTPAAVLAVVTVWTARASQASLGWGGFPTVMSVAIGVFAARLLWQHMRSCNWRMSLATGAAIAAIPMIHGVGAGTWLYCVGPWIALAALLHARDRKSTLRGLVVSAALTALFLLIYRAAGTIDVQARDMDMTHEWQQSSTPLVGNAWLAAIAYIRKDSGSIIVLAGWAACGVLTLRRQWLAALLLAAAWLALTLVVANSRWWILPASFLLYPERALYWAAPLSAVGLALAWRALSNTSPQRQQGPSIPLLALRACMAFAMLALAAYHQNQFYQKIVREDFVNADGWEALTWARQNLQPARDFVHTPYNSTGSFLPAIAQIGCNGAHHHHFIERQVHEMYGRRKPTHVLIDQALAPNAPAPTGTVVFRNRTITIMEINGASSRRLANDASAKRR